MIRDFELENTGATLDCDLCIVGAGPAGIAMADEFADGPLRVVLLDSGGLRLSDPTQALNVGVNAGLPHTGHVDGRGRAFGGTGRLWAGQCLPLDDIDFERRGWVPHSGWPIAPATLKAAYARAEKFFKVQGEVYDARVYSRLGLEAPAWDERTLRSHFTIYTPEVDTGRFALARVRASGNVTVLLNASVVQIELLESTAAVASLRLRSLGGRTGRVRARAYVLAAGGIENARLLLASNERVAAGVGNARDLVGRFFQEHPNGITATLDDADPVALQARFRMLYREGRRYFPKFALAADRQRSREVLNANAHLVFDDAPGSGIEALREFAKAARARRLPPAPLRAALRIARDAVPVARTLASYVTKGSAASGTPKSVRLQCYLEQSPNPDSRVMLSDERDAVGLPQLKMHWAMSELEHSTLREMTTAVGEEFSRLGLGRVRPEAWVGSDGPEWRDHFVDCAHHSGTTRMAASPSEGVVDPDARVFGVANLWVAGSSVFPTSGYANPTLTIVALALRLADRLQVELSTQVAA